MLFKSIFALASALVLPLVQGQSIHHSRQIFSSRDGYLNAHNSLRASHNAEPLEWSDQLADLARGWSGDCNFRATEGVLREEKYGENIAAGTGFFSAEAFVDLIGSDAPNWNPENPQFNGFSQAVWKNTTEIGCANKRCVNVFGDERPGLATIHVCFYSPAGNVNGHAGENVDGHSGDGAFFI